MKKTAVTFFTFLIFICGQLMAQYPATPTQDKVIAGIKSWNGNWYNSLVNDGLKVPAASRSAISFVPATKELGFYATTVYYRSDIAHKAGQGKDFNDEMAYNIVMLIPKEAFGAAIYYPIRVTYSRLNNSYVPVSEWRLKFVETLDSEVKIVGIDMPDEAKRKEIMVNYFKDHFKEIPGGHLTENFFRRIIKIEDVIVDKSTQAKATGILTWKWEMVLKVEKRSGTDVEVEFEMFDVNVSYNTKTKVFTPQSLNTSKNNPGGDYVSERKTYTPEKPLSVGNLYDNGWEAVYKKYAPLKNTAYSQKSFDATVMKFDTLLKSVSVNAIPDNVTTYFGDETALNDFKEAVSYWRSDNKDLAEWKVSEANYYPQVKNDLGQVTVPYSGQIFYDVNFKHIQNGKKKKDESELPYLQPAGMRFYWEYKNNSFKIIKIEKA